MLLQASPTFTNPPRRSQFRKETLGRQSASSSEEFWDSSTQDRKPEEKTGAAADRSTGSAFTDRGSTSKAMKGLVGGAAAGLPECRKQWITALIPPSSGQGTHPSGAAASSSTKILNDDEGIRSLTEAQDITADISEERVTCDQDDVGTQERSVPFRWGGIPSEIRLKASLHTQRRRNYSSHDSNATARSWLPGRSRSPRCLPPTPLR